MALFLDTQTKGVSIAKTMVSSVASPEFYASCLLYYRGHFTYKDSGTFWSFEGLKVYIDQLHVWYRVNINHSIKYST